MRTIPYPTPGEILFGEFLKPMAITQYRIAKEIGVPQRRIGEIVAGKRAIAEPEAPEYMQQFEVIGTPEDLDGARDPDLAQGGHAFKKARLETGTKDQGKLFG